MEKPDTAGLFNVAARLQGLPAKVKAATPGDVDVLKLSESDVNCLLAAAFSKDGLATVKADEIPVSNICAKLRDGSLQVDFTKDIGFWTPFGRNVNAHCKVKFDIDESNGAEASLLKLKLGKLNVAPWLVQWWIDNEVAKMNDPQESEDFRKIVVSVKTPPGVLLLKYHPYELKQLIETKLNSPLIKGFWDML